MGRAERDITFDPILVLPPFLAGFSPVPKLNASSLDLRPLYYFVQVAERRKLFARRGLAVDPPTRPEPFH